MKQLKLGSLFDGSGGFPLAGSIHGIIPVWASEIEPFPIRVTKLRFPAMKHLGSVTDVNGAEIEPVDIITFGSPCQDLSVAGKQAGIHDGERSNLFFEAVRIIKEMREHDRATGRTDVNLRPRFAVWENVPGAFSSNKGEDFRAVLKALCSVCDEHADIPQPQKGRWQPAGCIVGDGYSIAWRVYDAQYWGVPQRRKRIYLVADFASERAGEILFESESVSRDSEPCGEAREKASDDAEGGAGRDNKVKCLTPWDSQGNQITDGTGIYPTIRGCGGAEYQQGYVLQHNEQCYALKGNCLDRNTQQNGRPFCEDVMFTLDSTDRHGVVYGADCKNGTPGNSACFQNTGHGWWNESDCAATLRTPTGGGGNGAINANVVCTIASSCLNAEITDGSISPTLLNRAGTGGNQLPIVVFDARGNGTGRIAPTITGDHQNRITDYTAICVESENE